MTYFKIHDIGNFKVCFSQSYIGFDNYIRSVENELKSKSYVGEVILDLKSSNGENDRFFKCVFENDKFNLMSFKEFLPTQSFIHKCDKRNVIENVETVLA